VVIALSPTDLIRYPLVQEEPSACMHGKVLQPVKSNTFPILYKDLFLFVSFRYIYVEFQTIMGKPFIHFTPESLVEEPMARKIVDGKLTIHKCNIVVGDVIAYMCELGRYCTSVELRNHFGWPLRETARQLMKLLAEEGKVVIVDNPTKKRSYVYGLPKMEKPTAETFAKPKPKEKNLNRLRQPKKPALISAYSTKPRQMVITAQL
jgi:hypothetical protein